MFELEQKDNYVASDRIKPEIFNQIGRNIKTLAENMTIITASTEPINELPDGHIHIVYEEE